MASWLLERFRELEEKSKSWPDWVWEQPLTREDAEKLARGESLRRSPRAMATDDYVIERALVIQSILMRLAPGGVVDDYKMIVAALRASRARVGELERDRDEIGVRLLDWRGLTLETACKRCRGAGVRAYGSTATWRGGVGGQAITSDVCDGCWGSGDANNRWPSHRIAAALGQPEQRERESDVSDRLLNALIEYAKTLRDKSGLTSDWGDDLRMVIKEAQAIQRARSTGKE